MQDYRIIIEDVISELDGIVAIGSGIEWNF
jgi:hypothetical protein